MINAYHVFTDVEIVINQIENSDSTTEKNCGNKKVIGIRTKNNKID